MDHATSTLLALAGLSLLPLSGAHGASTPSRARSDRIALNPCGRPGQEGEALCATLTVAEDPNSPGGRQIDLNIVVLPAISQRPGMAPLFHLDGGPGIAATSAAMSFYLGPGADYRRSRDVVLVDQRGSGKSHPLHCPRLEAPHELDDEYPEAEVVACRRELEGAADLSKYSTAIAAGDLDRVRQALGHARIDLWALSYGTRLAQTYMKHFPSRVRSAVLAGFAPLDYRAPLYHAVTAQRVLDLVFYECQRDAACGAKYPNLRAEWRSLLRTLDAAPQEVAMGAKERVIIRRGPFGEALRNLLGTAAGQRRVPRLIHAAAAGDFKPFLDELPKNPSALAEGLYLTIACSEGGARIRRDEIAQFTNDTFLGDYRVTQELAACARWPSYPVPADAYDSPRTEVPILVLSGGMDHVTAPEWAREFCSSQPNCRFVSIPGLGHGPFDLDAWTNGACFDELAIAFYSRPGALNTSCLKGMRPPAFE